MAESGTLSSDSPLTAAEKKASKDWAENKTLRVDLFAALSENAKLKARLSLRQQQTDAASASYREVI
ncbi:hypothetical protein V6N11_000511 [Hibiscus sabdariffa]|uniref:Uncharacterized protein n=2 Tax=Hibiscus sabdariffa TaxID=183260 RepID=A0ABR2NT50_9ROSI